MRRTLVLLAALLAGAAGTARAQYAVIVNAANPVTSLTKDEASKLFLKKTTKWADGKAVVPVDQDKTAKVRENFCVAVLGRPASAVASYWQQQIFSGEGVPPAEKKTDAAIVSFVAGDPGAIGYVSTAEGLGSGVKVVAIK